jgi:hypothetical protein
MTPTGTDGANRTQLGYHGDMDNTRTITLLTQLIDDMLISGDYPGLESLTGTARDRNGDLLVHFSPRAGAPDTIRISDTTSAPGR